MVTDCLTDRLGSEPILSIKRFVSIGTMLNVDSDYDCDGHGDGTCKQALRGQQQEQKHSLRFPESLRRCAALKTVTLYIFLHVEEW